MPRTPGFSKRRRSNRREYIYTRDSGTCWLCGTKADRATFTLDHVVPKSKGGTDSRSNLKVAHRKCNNVRGSDDPTPVPVRYFDAAVEASYLWKKGPLTRTLAEEGLGEKLRDAK
jgi:5-methylcytosine-specific restriction endonuclease McrA